MVGHHVVYMGGGGYINFEGYEDITRKNDMKVEELAEVKLLDIERKYYLFYSEIRAKFKKIIGRKAPPFIRHTLILINNTTFSLSV